MTSGLLLNEREPDVSASVTVDGHANDLRVLVASHGHPRLSKGGAENAAHMLHEGLAARPGCQSWFLGCERSGTLDRLGSRITQPFEERDFVYSAGAFEWFHFANRDAHLPNAIEELLNELRPNIVHLHHYANFGVELIELVKRYVPGCKVVLTLHEFLAICNHFGQMVTVGDLNLCYQATLTKCHKCFPSISAADFFLRNHYIQRFFDLVDAFVSPSEFLAERYIDWGVPADRLSVIENVIPSSPNVAPPVGADTSTPLRVGFFGQISMLKGINVLLGAAETLARDEADDVVFDVFGDHRGQPPDFQKDFLERRAKAGPNIRFHGPYDSNRVDVLMQSVDVIVMPSIWWENSPVVIQEAFRNKRPVICSDIGGMAEKVQDGVNGLHFSAGSAVGLAGVLKKLAADRRRLARMSAAMPPPVAADDVLDQHVDLYDRIRTQS